MTTGTVLIVEDAPEITLALRIMLERAGHTVVVAHDGPVGLERFAVLAPDCVLLDIGLPGADGFEVLERIRESSDVPVFLRTARIRPEDRERGLALGATAYLVKPLGVDEVVDRVADALGRRGG